MTGRKVTPTGVLVAPPDLPRDEWLSLRQSGIGGSDIGALLGMNRYTSPFRLYLEKRGELPDLPVSEWLERAARWGHLHEPLLAAEFSERYGLRTRRVGLIRHETDPWRIANLDYRVSGCSDGPCLLEIKNRSAYKAGDWGPSEAEDGVPDNEALQTYHYLGVTGYQHAHVAVLLNGNDDRYYRIDWDDQLIADITAMAGEFWQRVVDGDPPPLDGHAALTELMAVLYAGEEDAELEVSEATVRALIAERSALKDRADDIETAIAGIENQLKGLLGEHEIAVGADRRRIYTWKRNGNLAVKRLREAEPELAAKYVRLVEDFDVAAFKADHPDLYRAHRARVLRISSRR